MIDERIHRANSVDGTEIAGRVHGQGPPLVLVHGAPHDGDVAWEDLVPHLTDRFTCYLPSLRGRGLSEDNADHSPPRLQEDVSAFVDSIDKAVYLAGWSAGVSWALAAAHSDAVTAVAAYEPTIIPVMREEDGVLRRTMYEQFAEAAADGRLADAMRAFHTFICTDTEMAALDADYYERCGTVVPALLQDGQQAASYEGPPLSTDPEMLAKIAGPLLLLRGQDTQLDTFYEDTECHVAKHVADAHIREPLPGLGHLGPLLAPEPIAKELISFFESVGQPI